jgi:hypothetical protein
LEESELIEFLKAEFEVIRERKASLRKFLEEISKTGKTFYDEIERGRGQPTGSYLNF